MQTKDVHLEASRRQPSDLTSHPRPSTAVHTPCSQCAAQYWPHVQRAATHCPQRQHPAVRLMNRAVPLPHSEALHPALDPPSSSLPPSYRTAWSAARRVPTQQQQGREVPDKSAASAGTSTSASGWTFDDDAERQDVQALYRLEQSRLYRRRSSDAPDLDNSEVAVITQIPAQLRSDVLRSALLLVDKPQDWTDDEVIRALLPNFRLHPAPPPPKRSSAGRSPAARSPASQPTISRPTISQPSNLEPMATGLLVLCLGDASRLTPAFHPLNKVYSGVLKLGQSTDTWDVWGRPVEELPWEHVTDEALQSASENMQGEVLLVPPQHSAVRVGGRRFIRPTNERDNSQPQVQPVRINSFSCWREPGSSDVNFEVTLNQSQFIRSLVHSLGRSLGTAAHLSSLRRESLGPFSVQDAWPLDVLLPLLQRYRKIAQRTRRRW